MLMRSPVHPSLMRWALRPEPAGRRRLALAYLIAALGSAAAAIVLGITLLVTRQCQVGTPSGFGCMTPFFDGIGFSILAGLLVAAGFSVFVRLGVRFVAGLVAVAAPVLMISQLLSILGVESRPYALIALLSVPAVASWVSGRVLRQPNAERPALRQASQPVCQPAGRKPSEAGTGRLQLLEPR